MPIIQKPPSPKIILPGCGLIDLFLHQVEALPTQLAFVEGDFKLTYAGLLAMVRRFARELRRETIEFEQPVGILTEKGLDHIIAQLAVVFVGATCMPLDPSLSDEQLQVILDDAGSIHIVTDAGNQHRPFGSIRRFTVEHGKLSQLSEETFDCAPTRTYPDTRSHILYTSGSTGKPKGVQDLAIGIYRMIQWSGIHSADRVGHATSPSFDISLIDIWVTLICGATIINIRKDVIIDPFAFARTLKEFGVTWMHVTTGIFNIVAVACPSTFSSLRCVTTGGEAANIKAMKLVLENGPPGRLVNAYGPTECSLWCTSHEVTLEELTTGRVSIGGPIYGTEVYLLDENLKLVPGTNIGEICVGGVGVSPGYINRPDQNEKAFVTVSGISKDGKAKRIYRTGDLACYNESRLLEYIGRRDNQVKIRGFRIELEAVETALINTELVSLAAAVKIQPPQAETGAFLVAYVVLKPGEGISLESVSKKLNGTLPDYSTPRLQTIDKLPLNSSGKVHHKKLIELYFQTCSEQSSKIGPNDNYFTLGGTSLQVATLIFKIRQEFGITITTDVFYHHQTLLEMAQYIDHGHRDGQKSVDTEKRMLEDASLSDEFEPLNGPIPDWRSGAEGDVFVTGATGFLGAYLVHALLQMPEVTTIRCLVRAKNIAHGLSRIREAFIRYGIYTAKQQERLMSKLVVLPGDLADPNLGLDRVDFENAARSCAAIFHFGALVNYVQPYLVHRPANTIGTLNILRLAVSGRPKAIHYSSTFVAHGPTGLFNGPITLSEDEPLDAYLKGLSYDLGYAQSQWVAEQLLWRAISKGIPIAIYRPGFILGHSQTGYGNPDDFMGRFIVSCIKMGTYPILPKQRKEFIPVDHCVRDILHISSSNANIGRAYAIVPIDPSTSVEWNETFEILRRCGDFDLRGLRYRDWVDQLPEVVDRQLQPLMPMLKEKVYGELTRWEVYENMAVYQADNTRQAIANSKKPQGCSPLNEKLLRLYLKGWFEQTDNLELIQRICPTSGTKYFGLE
ncbi:hypothetical protein Dda_2433 [Drechslerella dactyloides]|uniref:Carrier domain-containing protein n=1 Tax=Drechslerella dactyloides TaxID=74499 RepID=A0AAD6NLI4_DREDA|nr:hypothetical protein Dda_2433 [Drechslerella dactyloides]